MRPLEMWGGLECTLNRVGNRYVSQNQKNGHLNRLSDLQLFADLNIKKIRYPCLWEQVAPEHPDHKDWRWLDERLGELKKLGISPIAGFLHHGSGPCYTSLIDPEFPQKLADYARAFAERFPWVEDYTPINEINTTARFSCLYGHWYPHHKSDESYLRALLMEVKGTILAMREIRKINPKARLIQTDDMGRAQSTELLKYQCDFENNRRWLSYDLLCGKVNQEHELYWYFKDNNICNEDLRWIEENRCPPDIIGINHYHLSNRFLDHRLELYPACFHGGNGTHQYADVGAIDTGQVEPPSPESLMMESWYRYHIPVSITEVHTRGNRDSQMRWLYQVWNNALSARDKGAEIVSITAWSLLGTFDWHNLCTRCEMFYESGVFDLRSSDGHPRPTGIVRLIQDLTSKGFSDHPILEDDGIWTTPRRVLFAATEGSFSSIHRKGRPILITGATGTLGQAFARICGSRNMSYRLLKRSEMDIGDLNSIRKAVAEIKPWAVINAAGYVKVDQAEDEQELCFRENVHGPVNLAQVCAENDLPFVTFSSDLVFDGNHHHDYFESHKTSPLNIYGLSKALCEEKVLKLYPSALVIRTSSFFGPWDDYNFITTTLRTISQKKQVFALNDVKVTPTYVPDLVDSALDLLLDGEHGLLHLTNQGSVSWAEFGKLAIEGMSKKFQLDRSLLIEQQLLNLNLRAKRPRNSALASERWKILPSLENALDRYFSHVGNRL